MIEGQTKAPEFSISVTDLDISGKSVRFELRPDWIRGILEECEATTDGKPGLIEVRLSKSGPDVVVHGKLNVRLEIPCARCLEPSFFRVDKSLSGIFVQEKKLNAKVDEELEITAEDADMLPYDGDTILLDDLVRDELVLETPMIPLCSEDCPGMSVAPSHQAAEVSTAEDESAIDPRLLPLLKLRNRGTT
jgi:uncharacterized protein